MIKLEDFDHTQKHSEECTVNKVEGHTPTQLIVSIAIAREKTLQKLCTKIPIEFRNQIEEKIHVNADIIYVCCTFKPLINGECS